MSPAMRKRIIVGALLTVLLLGAAHLGYLREVNGGGYANVGGPIRVTLPHCEEDEGIRGVGDFHAGHWSRYECVGDTVSDTRETRPVILAKAGTRLTWSCWPEYNEATGDADRYCGWIAQLPDYRP